MMIVSELIKKCSKCGEEKELSSEYWSRNKNTKDGFQSQCKECQKITSKEYRAKNKEKMARYRKEYYEENKEKIARQSKQYREENKEKIAEQQKEYKAKNKEKIARYQKQYDKEYRAKNKEKIARQQKKYREDNKEYLSKYSKQYWQSEQGRKNYARAQQARRARVNSLPDTLTTEQYNENLNHFDYKCAYCECELTPDNHHIEHVYPISRGVYGTTKENCIPSCDSCNSSKHAKTLAEWYVWTEDYSFERLLKIHEITSGGKEWIVN